MLELVNIFWNNPKPMLLFDMTNVLFVFPVYSQKRSDDKKDEPEFVCPEGQGNGNFADPATCRRFYQVLLHAHHSILLKMTRKSFIFCVTVVATKRLNRVWTSFARLFWTRNLEQVRNWLKSLCSFQNRTSVKQNFLAFLAMFSHHSAS